MSLCNCTIRCSCILKALIASLVIGIIGTFLQITAVFTITPAVLQTAIGIAIGFLGLLLLSPGRGEDCCSRCSILSAILTGILGTILFSALLLAVGIVATSILTAALTGLVLFFLALLLTGTACWILCRTDCEG